MGPTYEFLCNNARKQSESLGRYAAVVDITTYLSDQVKTTVMVSTSPIVSRQRGGQFIGVGAQWFKGLPYGAAPAPEPARAVADTDDDVLPF